MVLKSLINIISDFGNLIFDEGDQNTSGFVDESLGKMKLQEVLDIVLPLAERVNYVSEIDGRIFGKKEIGLFKYEKTNQLVWIVNFGWLEIDGEEIGNNLDTTIASIKVDDETGEIQSVWQKGMKSEMNYLNFLRLLEMKF